MYKGASRLLQHAHRVDRIDPGKGFVSGDGAADLIPNAGNMSLGMCRDELRQLSVEMAKLENALGIAKREKQKVHTEFLGQQKAALCARRAAVKERKRELLQEHDSVLLVQAIDAVCEEALKVKIFAHARQAREALVEAAA